MMASQRSGHEQRIKMKVWVEVKVNLRRRLRGEHGWRTTTHQTTQVKVAQDCDYQTLAFTSG